MSARRDATDWRQLNEFRHVDLEASFVLGWDLDGDALLVDLDLHLTPRHPSYEEPRPAEKVCIRPAVLEFPHCDSIRHDGDDSAADIREFVAGLRLGAIDGLCVYDDGIYEMSGKFGRVVIDSERPVLRMTAR